MKGVQPMGAFWDIIQGEVDRERFTVSDRKLALRLKVSPSTIGNWRSGLNELPTVKNLRAVADFAGLAYEDVLLAALADTGHAEGTRLAEQRGHLAHGAGNSVNTNRPSPQS